MKRTELEHVIRAAAVVHLGDEDVSCASRFLRSPHLQLEPHRAEIVAEPFERPGQVGARSAAYPFSDVWMRTQAARPDGSTGHTVGG